MRRSLLIFPMALFTAVLLAFTAPSQAAGCASCPPPGGGSECTFEGCTSGGGCFTCIYDCGSDGICWYFSCDNTWECSE